MRTRLKHPVYDRDERYETATRNIRWVSLALVLITYPASQTYSLAIFTLLVAVAAYNGLRYNRRLMGLSGFSSRLNTLAVDHVWIVALVLFSGGLTSPYYPLLFLLIIGVIASYGLPGFALSLAGQVVFTPLLLFIKTEPLPSAPEFQFIIKIVFLILFSLVAERSVRSREDEHLLETRFSHRIENERQRLLSLINSLSNAVLAIDEQGKVYLYNASALELLNTNRDISGQHIDDLLPLHDGKYTTVNLFKLINHEDRAVSRQDLVYIANDGSEMILDLTVSPVHVTAYGRSNWGGYMVVFHDITKQKTLDQERDEFISVTSHELRTPLAIAEANLSTALLPGFAQIEPKALALLKQAHENTIFLSELIKDLGTLSRAERASFKFEKQLVDLVQLIDDLERDYRPQLEAKGLEFHVHKDEQVHKILTSEPELREIIQNFLTNAIKYTPKGSVTLTLAHQADEAAISVQDTGIGIAASDKIKLFNKFYRSEDYRTRSTSGTGLGLYITKKLAERLGFTITFDSRLNHGSTFTLKVPYHVPVEEAQAVAVAAQQTLPS